MVFLRVTCAWAAAILAASVLGCGASKSSSDKPATGSRPTILTGQVRPIPFAQVKRSVLDLYDAHPSISRFTVQDVEYTRATRDKVLTVCHRGGPEKSASALESARVLACAPLIFFFYSYGRTRSVPASINVARQLYWYAVASNQRPHDAEPGLKTLLRRWGVR